MVIEQFGKQKIYFDNLSDGKIKTVFKQMKGRKVLVVCSKGNRTRIGDCLNQCGQNKVWFSDFSSNPVYEDIKKAVALFLNEQCDSIISLGGGSAIDVAKCVKAFCNMDEKPEYTKQQISPNAIEHLAIPTTAGTGSESTHFAVLYEKGRKKSISDPSLLPDYVWLNPAFIKTLPSYQKKCTMLDALCQAIESFWSVRATDESKKYASSAITGILRYAEPYLEECTDKPAEADILWAANLAGRAIDITQTTAAHAMSYKLTSNYNIPHGQAVAVCLPGVWKFLISNTEICTDVRGREYLEGMLRQLTRLFGVESNEDAVKALEAFYQSVSMEKEAVVAKEDLEELARSVDMQRLGNFPVKIETKDIYEIYAGLTQENAGNDAEYIYWYTASRMAAVREERYNILKVMPQMAVCFQDKKRRTDAAWCVFKCIEYGLFYPEIKTDADWKKEFQNLMGSLVSYCFQYDAGMYYFRHVKKIIRQIEKSEWDAYAEKLSELLHIDAELAYIFVAKASVSHTISQSIQEGKTAGFMGVPDDGWVRRVMDGLVHQLDLFVFHYFTEEEQEVLRGMFDFTDEIRQTFYEQQEKVICRNIISACCLEDTFERQRRTAYQKERAAFGQEMFSHVMGEFESAGISYSWDDEGGRIMIGEGDAQKAAGICKDKADAFGKAKREKSVIRLYKTGTSWKESFDAKEKEAFLEIAWGEEQKKEANPYLARFFDSVYAFDEENNSEVRTSIKERIKEAIRKPFWKLKMRAKNKEDQSANSKEINRFIVDTKRKIVYTLFYKYRYQVDDKLILFESYHGEQYSCNPRGIYEAILLDERYIDYKFIWAVKDVRKYKYLEEDFRTKVVKSNSKKYYMYNAKAKYIILNLLLKPHITLKKEQTYIQTWHGKPIKAIGCGRQFETDPRRTLASTVRHYTKNAKKITKLLSPSDSFTPIMRDAFNMEKLHRQDRIYETGYARNDRLFRYTEIELMRIRQRLGIDPAKKVILYAPTWRELFGEFVEQQELGVVLSVSDSIDFEKMHKQLGDEYLLLFRAHHMDAEAMDISRYEGFIIDVTNYPDVNDLYMISDLMISDYSGTIFDFGILKRPMVYYMFDRELYTTKLQGVNIDLDELPGIIVEKEEDLVPAILKQFRDFQYDEKYERFNRKYNQYEDGHAGQRAIDLCISDTVSRKTITLQGSIKRFKNSLSFIYKPMKRLKLNVCGILREKGLIHDKNTKQLLELKNKYKGQKCYLIGNGPSLKAEDLDMISDEITFGCNMVYKMFDKTKWRPSYHFIVDVIYTKNLYLEIKNNIRSPLITNSSAYHLMAQKPKNITYVNIFSQENYKIRGNMMAYYISARATVMTFMIEMAMFMGFKEIYLLGTDCTNSFTSGHFGEAYTASTLDKVNLARARVTIGDPDLTLEGLGEYRRQRSITAYEKIAKYAAEHNVKIYNATRGGALEVFERVRLEDTL